MSSNPGYTATAKSLHWCRAHQCITSRQHREFPLLLYPYAGLHPKHAASSQGCTTQSRQPTNQVITFPQISAIWASTNRPIRTLRQFKLLSRSVIIESPLTP